jgi:RNA polymerase sigma factor for flagellar operon FliA
MSKPNRELVTQLLQRYHETKEIEIRNELILLFLPLVHTLSEKIHSRLPQSIELDDIKSAGLFGLMQAINAFDACKGALFETYCTFRIRGSILDELRALDWVPRRVRSHSQKLENAFIKLSHEKKREPTSQELADYLKLTLEELEQWIRESSIISMLPFSHSSEGNEDFESFGEQLEDRKQMEPYQSLFKKELLEYITKGLNKKERLILILYHFEELTMKEIGKTLSLSEPRVSQIHSDILFRLRLQFEKMKLELLP